MMGIRPEVRKGARLLDERVGPERWRPRVLEAIRDGNLDMAQATRCVVGTVFDGDYEEGIAELLGIDWDVHRPTPGSRSREWIVEVGFDIHLDRTDTYDALAAEWEALLRE